MTEGPLIGVLLRVAGPIAAANIAQSAHQIINAIFVGRLGADAIAAVAASGPLFGVLLSLGSGLSTAGAVLVAQNTGAGKAGAANHVAAQTLLMVLAVGVAFALTGLLFAPASLRLIGVESGVFRLAWQYLTVTYAGLVPMYAFLALQAMLQGVGEVRFAMKVMMGAVALNIVLDPLLIFGTQPFGGSWSGIGVPGAALATVIAQSLAFAAVLRHMMSGHSALHLKRHDFRPDRNHIRTALGIGLPASVEQGARTFGSLLLMSLAALFGTVSLAAYGVGTRPFFFWFAPMIGLSIATSAVVGQNIGAGLMNRAEQAARISAWLGFIGFTVIGLVHLPLLRPLMAALAPGETEVIREAVTFGWAVFPFLGFMAVTQALNGAFRGAGSARQAMTISLVMQYALQIPFAWGTALFTALGVLGVWWSYAFSNVAAAALCAFWLLRGPWRRNLVKDGAAG
ncbi:MATE family efflux transporter [Erythrobacter sp. SG61-1L]|uniref:MATE family efflux transporter n=1 Tax=Erythrobacter sp. SG61-1L TaxID=1603897 RepID=UPI0006C90206|nr:MATE family efflux transporter [Erythrobacter sp. SG61-1L]